MLKSILGVLSPVHLRFFTLFRGGKCLGTDPLGNRYYQGKPMPGYKRPRRWVIYNGAPEASSVPPEWHGWLHHQTDIFPDSAASKYRKPWQKPPLENMTGTTGAYRPPGSLLSKGTRPQTTGDYEAWSPDSEGL